MRKGQIQYMKHRGLIETSLVIGIGALLATLVSLGLGVSWKSLDSSNKAVDRVSVTEATISGLKSEVKAVNDKVDLLLNYFKLTPKDGVSKK